METISETDSRILVVDDEAATAASVSFVLKHSGHVVDIVTDGEDALLQITQYPDRYRFVVTDHAMKGVSGLELVERLRKIEFRGRIVVLSAYLSWSLERSYRALGVDRFISKPFDLADLRCAVEEPSSV